MNQQNVAKVAQALDDLGQAYRGDWNDFDGRTLRHELEELAAALRSDTPFNLVRWYLDENICPDARSWAEHCDETSREYSCSHLDALRAAGA